MAENQNHADQPSAAAALEASAEIKISVGISTAEFEARWEAAQLQIAEQFAGLDDDTVDQEAASWAQFKYLMLKDYSRQMLALQAKLERLKRSMRATNIAIEARFKAAIRSWSEYLERSLSGAVHAALRARVRASVTKHLEQRSSAIALKAIEQIDTGGLDDMREELDRLSLELSARVSAQIIDGLPNKVETAFDELSGGAEAAITAKATAKLQGSLRALISGELADFRTDSLDAAVSGELRYLRNKVLRLKQKIQMSIMAGDRQLHGWAVEEILGLKTCVSNRGTLLTELDALATALGTALDRSRCATSLVNERFDVSPAALPDYLLFEEEAPDGA